jgi:hypothetical protein
VTLKRRKKLARKTSLKQKVANPRKTRTPVKKVNVARREREFKRAYGSKERVEWVKSCVCILCSATPCDNAHVKSKSGMGRKGHYTTIAALCRKCHIKYDTGKCSEYEVKSVESDAAYLALIYP